MGIVDVVLIRCCDGGDCCYGAALIIRADAILTIITTVAISTVDARCRCCGH